MTTVDYRKSGPGVLFTKRGNGARPLTGHYISIDGDERMNSVGPVGEGVNESAQRRLRELSAQGAVLTPAALAAAGLSENAPAGGPVETWPEINARLLAQAQANLDRYLQRA